MKAITKFSVNTVSWFEVIFSVKVNLYAVYLPLPPTFTYELLTIKSLLIIIVKCLSIKSISYALLEVNGSIKFTVSSCNIANPRVESRINLNRF